MLAGRPSRLEAKAMRAPHSTAYLKNKESPVFALKVNRSCHAGGVCFPALD
jgi:hypothetical protein